jgi:hypothetical protein
MTGDVSPTTPRQRRLWFAGLIALCVLTALRIVATYRYLSPTGDEHTHIATGGEYIRFLKYTYDAEHPPLARVVFACSLAMLGTQADDPFPPRPGRVGIWTEQENKGLVPRGNYMVSVNHARIGNLLFVVIAIAGVAFLGTALLGPIEGLTAGAVFAILPTTLANGALCTTDMAGTALLPWALLALHRWLANPTWRRTIAFGAILGIGLVTKFSFAPYFGVCAIVMIASRRTLHLRRASISLVIAAMVIWATYLFDHGRLGRMYADAPDLAERFLGSRWIAEAVNIPAPRFLFGFLVVLLHSARGHPSYLFGKVSQMGWWYYFPAVLVFKTPIPLLILAAAGTWLMITRRTRIEIPLMALLILCVAMTSHINIGVRHVLPIYTLWSILAAYAVVALWSRRRVIVIALSIWLVAGSFLAHPDYLPWMNAFALGHPERIAVESNFDWGQDILRLADECRKLGVASLGYHAFGNVDPDRIGLPPTHDIDAFSPSAGWIAVSEGAIVAAQARDPRAYKWLTGSRPFQRVGKTVRLYHLDEVRPADRNRLGSPIGAKPR